MKTATKARNSVAFCLQPEIQSIAPRTRLRKSTLNMDEKIFQRFTDSQVTDDMLQEASRLFSENYGVWGEQAAQQMGKFAVAGKSAQNSSHGIELTVC